MTVGESGRIFLAALRAYTWPAWILALPSPARKHMGLLVPRYLAKSRAAFKGAPFRPPVKKYNRYWHAHPTHLR